MKLEDMDEVARLRNDLHRLKEDKTALTSAAINGYVALSVIHRHISSNEDFLADIVRAATFFFEGEATAIKQRLAELGVEV